MSLHTKPRAVRRPTGVAKMVADDLSAVLLNFPVPRTRREWVAWQRRRDRYRLALANWAVEQAHADPTFDARAELISMIRLLGLTRADDAGFREMYAGRTRPSPSAANGRRAMSYRDKRGG